MVVWWKPRAWATIGAGAGVPQHQRRKLADAGLLEQAVAPARYAVGSARDPQQRGKYLLHLSGLLVLLHRRTQDPAVIREAVTAAEEAVRLSPDQQERYAREKVLRVAQAQQQLGGWIE
ncbi:hypothetical protein ACLQ3B_22250 [Micromonospora sp. DT53]|uniref:hypothetical protein n=1 Tax=Micromonospora sp. DT53 TaxID=3393444 RepID=UPI003CE6D436